jgi:hypothetical protein
VGKGAGSNSTGNSNSNSNQGGEGGNSNFGNDRGRKRALSTDSIPTLPPAQRAGSAFASRSKSLLTAFNNNKPKSISQGW